MLIATTSGNFTVGAILSWAIPITLVIAILIWWGTALTIRAFRARQQNNERAARSVEGEPGTPSVR